MGDIDARSSLDTPANIDLSLWSSLRQSQWLQARSSPLEALMLIQELMCDCRYTTSSHCRWRPSIYWLAACCRDLLARYLLYSSYMTTAKTGSLLPAVATTPPPPIFDTSAVNGSQYSVDSIPESNPPEPPRTPVWIRFSMIIQAHKLKVACALLVLTFVSSAFVASELRLSASLSDLVESDCRALIAMESAYHQGVSIGAMEPLLVLTYSVNSTGQTLSCSDDDFDLRQV